MQRLYLNNTTVIILNFNDASQLTFETCKSLTMGNVMDSDFNIWDEKPNVSLLGGITGPMTGKPESLLIKSCFLSLLNLPASLGDRVVDNMAISSDLSSTVHFSETEMAATPPNLS